MPGGTAGHRTNPPNTRTAGNTGTMMSRDRYRFRVHTRGTTRRLDSMDSGPRGGPGGAGRLVVGAGRQTGEPAGWIQSQHIQGSIYSEGSILNPPGSPPEHDASWWDDDEGDDSSDSTMELLDENLNKLLVMAVGLMVLGLLVVFSAVLTSSMGGATAGNSTDSNATNITWEGEEAHRQQTGLDGWGGDRAPGWRGKDPGSGGNPWRGDEEFGSLPDTNLNNTIQSGSDTTADNRTSLSPGAGGTAAWNTTTLGGPGAAPSSEGPGPGGTPNNQTTTPSSGGNITIQGAGQNQATPSTVTGQEQAVLDGGTEVK